ncbi:hypothetical protein BKA56DRAFT_676468 [Ilyonectria sp. MPI-CAGE-AT-0026]|nr:hypothetical protein BKA56DRAFT_676468 [Ilyonectria sp. MPI-CAGE-AT-0026]
MTTESEKRMCDIEANPDLYGIGIRIGIYCQWLATALANMHLPEEANAIQTTTLCFQTAIMGALILLSAQGALAQPEVLVVLTLAFGGFVAARFFEASPAVSDSAESPKTSAFGTWVMIQILGAVSVYGLWFWATGLGDAQSQHCSYVTLILTKVEIQKLRPFGIVVNTISCALLAVADSFLLYWVIKKLWHASAGNVLVALLDPQQRLRRGDLPLWRLWLDDYD